MESLGRIVIVAKGFLKLPDSHMLIKQKILSLPKNLAVGTFVKLLLVFTTKVILPYLLYSKAQRYCIMHLISKLFC